MQVAPCAWTGLEVAQQGPTWVTVSAGTAPPSAGCPDTAAPRFRERSERRVHLPLALLGPVALPGSPRFLRRCLAALASGRQGALRGVGRSACPQAHDRRGPESCPGGSWGAFRRPAVQVALPPRWSAASPLQSVSSASLARCAARVRLTPGPSTGTGPGRAPRAHTAGAPGSRRPQPRAGRWWVPLPAKGASPGLRQRPDPT